MHDVPRLFMVAANHGPSTPIPDSIGGSARMTSEQFDRVTLYREGRKAVLGAVIAPAMSILSSQPREYGIQLVGRNPFTNEEVAQWYSVIRQCIVTQEECRIFYFPTYGFNPRLPSPITL
jgi:hypothetical protein